MSDALVATRRFTWSDQERFASLSSDRNPMHMDPVYARRTQPGAPVVHGIHVLLWALEQWAAQGERMCRLCEVKVRFTKFVYVDRVIELRIVSDDAGRTALTVVDDGLAVLSITLLYGDRSTSRDPPGERGGASTVGEVPAQPSLQDMRGLAGRLMPLLDADVTCKEFPCLAGTVGASRVSAIMQLSPLVGMVCPGLHSIFSLLQFSLVDGDAVSGLGWSTRRVDERYRLVRIGVTGSGIDGEVTAFARREPAPVVSMAGLTGLVQPQEFQGTRALIIGGSRGLGAACAKILCAGGASVVVSYVAGHLEAAELMRDITAARGESACDVARFDVREASACLPEGLGEFDQMYYFATSQIFRQKREVYAAELFDEFVGVYVNGFHAVVRQLRQRAGHRPLAVFYPSSVAVEDGSPGMTEYVMAKLAGEALCASLVREDDGLRCIAHRIPRTATDQTATVAPTEEADPVEVMLPLVRQMRRALLDMKH